MLNLRFSYGDYQPFLHSNPYPLPKSNVLFCMFTHTSLHIYLPICLSYIYYLSIWLSLCLFICWPRWHHHLQTFPTSLSLSPLYCSMKNCFNDIIILSFFLQKSYQFVSISCWVGSSRVNTWASKAIDTLMLSVIIELTLESLACLALIYSR